MSDSTTEYQKRLQVFKPKKRHNQKNKNLKSIDLSKRDYQLSLSQTMQFLLDEKMD